MRIAFTLIGFLIASASLGQEPPGTMWKWVDKDGVTHYSDQPGPDAVKVNLREQTYAPPERTSPVATPTRTAAPTNVYRSIVITSPAAEETLQNPDGPVQVGVRIDPALQSGHRVRLEVDGQSLGEPSASLSFQLTDVPRGAHTVQATIIDSENATLMQSAPVTFHVLRQSLLLPNKPR